MGTGTTLGRQQEAGRSGRKLKNTLTPTINLHRGDGMVDTGDQDRDLNKRKETKGMEMRQRGQAAFGVLGTQNPSFKVLT